MNQIMEEFSPMDWVSRLTYDWSGRCYSQRRFLSEMITGIVGSADSRLSSVARFLDEPCSLKHTHKRLSRMLNDTKIDYEQLRDNIVSAGVSRMWSDDVIAFDPGDITKPHAEKMQNLTRVHDGSSGGCENGYEDISVEAIQRYAGGGVRHIPLYQKLVSSASPEYVSQNRQILDAIHAVYQKTREKGIFVFDRGHDRSRIYEKALLPLEDMRWVMRVMHDRSVKCEDERYFKIATPTKLLELVKIMDMSTEVYRPQTSRKTSKVSVGWASKINLRMGKTSRKLSLVVVHDRRNKKPVILLTTISVSSIEEALNVWKIYLDRWAKEEGYRLTKQALGAEKIRSLNWEAIQAQALIVWMAYAYMCWVDYRHAKNLDVLSESRLKNFRSIARVNYRYYRIQKVLSLLLEDKLQNQQSKAA